MDVAVLLFTRDLRLHDNPALVAAVEEAETVLPLFVLDEGIGVTRYGSAPNRRAFLEKSLVDLDASLRRIGGALAVRRGEVVTETARAAREVGATTVFATADVSAYARKRERRLGAELDLRLVDGKLRRPAGRGDPDREGPLRGLHAVLPRLVGRTVRDAAARAEGDPAPERGARRALC